jgi:hypothetical protein
MGRGRRGRRAMRRRKGRGWGWGRVSWGKRGGALGVTVLAEARFSKSLSIVYLYIKYTRALTFENFCGGGAWSHGVTVDQGGGRVAGNCERDRGAIGQEKDGQCVRLRADGGEGREREETEGLAAGRGTENERVREMLSEARFSKVSA